MVVISVYLINSPMIEFISDELLGKITKNNQLAYQLQKSITTNITQNTCTIASCMCFLLLFYVVSRVLCAVLLICCVVLLMLLMCSDVRLCCTTLCCCCLMLLLPFVTFVTSNHKSIRCIPLSTKTIQTIIIVN